MTTSQLTALLAQHRINGTVPTMKYGSVVYLNRALRPYGQR